MTNKMRFEQAFGEIVKIDSIYLKVKYVDKDGDFGLNSQSKTVAFQKMSNGALYPIKVETLKKNAPLFKQCGESSVNVAASSVKKLQNVQLSNALNLTLAKG